MGLSVEARMSREVELIRQMAGKLGADIRALEGIKNQGCPKTFLKFCDIRDLHNNIQGLIFVIQERYPASAQRLPTHMGEWIVRAKMKALSLFVEISLQFVKNPPLTLTGSLTARDVLANENKNFSEGREFFNKVLLEQALDDKTADKLVQTLEILEETIGIIEKLLENSVNYLEEF